MSPERTVRFNVTVESQPSTEFNGNLYSPDALRLENTVGVKGRGLQEQSERHEREAEGEQYFGSILTQFLSSLFYSRPYP